MGLSRLRVIITLCEKLAGAIINQTVFHPMQNSENTDVNTVTDYGFHIFASIPTINFPASTLTRIRFLIVYGYENRIIQVLITPELGLIHTREYRDTWSEWKQV